MIPWHHHHRIHQWSVKLFMKVLLSSMHALTILSHMMAIVNTSAEPDALQTEAFEVSCKVATGKY